jgi:DNA-directed RNA polymerase subunit RPC12/RpoP
MRIPLPTPSCTHFQTTELPCLKCGKQMKLTLIEPSGPKFEMRTYKCIPCDIDERFLMAK